MNKLKQLWSNLRSSFWFVPSLIVAFSIALAMALVQAHSPANSQWLARWPYLFGASAEGSRQMLSTIAGSMMTVVMCLNYLTAILARLASRGIPLSRHYEDGELRIIAVGPSFASLVAESFDQIRGSANGNVAIMIQMLGSIQTIASLTASPDRRQVLREQAQWINELAERTIESPHDKIRFDNRLALARKALETGRNTIY